MYVLIPFVDDIFKQSCAHFCTQWNGSNYRYLTLIITCNINHLFADKEVVPIIAIYTYYSTEHY